VIVLTERIVIPVENNLGINAQIAQHFGQAPYFALVELNGAQIAKVEIEKNTSTHMGGTGHPHGSILSLRPTAVVACGMGPGAKNCFEGAGVQVLQAIGVTVSEIIENYKNGLLQPLTAVCPHAHHHHEH
jgi:predicted Fe-Mo cluster-binding NifX family protein